MRAGGSEHLHKGTSSETELELGVTSSAPGPVGFSCSVCVGPEKEPLSRLSGFHLALAPYLTSKVPPQPGWSLTPQLPLPANEGLERGWVLLSSSTLLESWGSVFLILRCKGNGGIA